MQTTSLNQPLTACYLMDAVTNRCISSTYFSRPRVARWTWIQEVIAAHEGCEPEEVACIETDEGDKITACGRVVAYIAD